MGSAVLVVQLVLGLVWKVVFGERLKEAAYFEMN
tara:strand:- start:1213 stop:1314 length:102 start_codon:yes stop_codon:yes gene_type:complete